MIGLRQPSPVLDVTRDLLARINSGDEAALENLITRYLPVLRRIVRSQLFGHARSLLDTDDVVQDAVVSTVRRIPHFVWRSPGSLLAYLRRAIVNRIIDANRQCARQGECVALSEDYAADGASPLQRVIDKEAIRRYRAALLRLNRRDRRLIVMRMQRQLTYQEIATQLRMPSANAARAALVRATARLVSALEHV